MKTILAIIGFLVLAAAITLGIFHFAVPNEQKREVLEKLDLEDVPVLKELSKTAYIDAEVTNYRRTLFGDQWAITTLLTNTHDNLNMSEVTLRYHFSDGHEDRTYNVDLRSGRDLPSITSDKISGHNDAEFLKVEVMGAE